MRVFICAISIFAAGAMACRDSSGTTTTTSAGLVPNDVASQQVAVARCSHESACNNIGPDKAYRTIDTCLDKMKTDADARFQDCSNGVDSNELGQCFSDIRREACGNPVDAMSRILACSKTNLCR
jgi:hypothetical protein